MKQVTVLHYDAFASIPNKGNPAGVVLQADELTVQEMQAIARQVGFNETVFVLNSDQASVRLKFFTPGHEIDLCGHATIASLYCLLSTGRLDAEGRLTIQTNAGILPVHCEKGADGSLSIEMKHGRPQFHSFEGDAEELADAIGLAPHELHPELPIVYGSTGAWTLAVPVRELSSFRKMKPQTSRFPDVLREIPRASLHPFCLETVDRQAYIHARHFSSPYSRTIEDPVTGTGSGVLAAYDLTYIHPEKTSTEFVVEQGLEINRDGRVRAKAVRTSQGMDVFTTGTAVFVRQFDIEAVETVGEEKAGGLH